MALHKVDDVLSAMLALARELDDDGSDALKDSLSDKTELSKKRSQ